LSDERRRLAPPPRQVRASNGFFPFLRGKRRGFADAYRHGCEFFSAEFRRSPWWWGFSPYGGLFSSFFI